MNNRKIYLASSWRNPAQPDVVRLLRFWGHDVYDFRNPAPDNKGFSWKEISPNWEKWTSAEYRAALDSPTAIKGYGFDKTALDWCDTCILLLPSGKSAHLELAYCIGKGKKTAILMLSDDTPELMYKLAGSICLTLDELKKELS